jgi:regulator of G-protein signaling
MRQKSNLIWSTYLHDTDDGSCPINIDSRTRQECLQCLLNKPSAHIFEKAQSQIFQLMKYDSYTRFLKSNMYKECIMNEMEGKSLPSIKQQHHAASSSDERSKTLDSFV